MPPAELAALLAYDSAKAWLDALTISAAWITVAGQTVPRAVQVLPIAAADGFASHLSHAGLAASLRGWLAQGRRLRHFNCAMAAVPVASALWLRRA